MLNHFLNILHMGGYGWYVWPAYGITFCVFSINVITFLREKKYVKKIIRDYLKQSL